MLLQLERIVGKVTKKDREIKVLLVFCHDMESINIRINICCWKLQDHLEKTFDNDDHGRTEWGSPSRNRRKQ